MPYTDRVWDPEQGDYVTWSYGNVREYTLEDRDRVQVNASLSHFKDDWMGTHELKFGGEFEYAMTDKESGIPGDHFFQYRNGRNYRMDYTRGMLRSFRQERVSLFVQDAWSPTSGLTLNLGVRFDHASIDNEEEKLWTWTNTAPRIGLAWDLFKNGKDVIRGHYSRFYAPIITDYAENFSTVWPHIAHYRWYPGYGWSNP